MTFSSAVRTELDVDVVARGEGVDHLLDQHLRRRRAGGDADRARRPRSRSSRSRAARWISTAVGQPARSATSRRRCELDEFGAPTTIIASTMRRDPLHRLLAVGGGVADVFLVRPDDRREARLQHRDDLRGVVDRQRRLRDVGEIVRARAARSARASATVSTSVTAPGGSWPMVPIDLRMAGMADQHDLAAAPVMQDRPRGAPW